MKKWLSILLSGVVSGYLAFSSIAFADTTEQNNNLQLYAKYVSPEGISFQSYSKEWSRDKLKDLYEKILAPLPHGAEMSDLSVVRILPDGSQAAGDIDIDASAAIEDANGYPIQLLPGRTITLYFGDYTTHVRDYAFTLTHEYGHLFTYYWLIKKEHKWPDDPTIGWAQIRSSNFSTIRWAGSGWEYNWFWQPDEIMADDFVELFGSPETRKMLFHIPSDGSADNSFVDGIYNFVIPAAESTSEREYWLKLSGIQLKREVDRLTTPQLVSFKPVWKNGVTRYQVQYTPAISGPNNSIDYWVRWSTQDNSDFDTEDYLKLDSPFTANTSTLFGVVPPMKAFIRIYAYDVNTGQLTYSPVYWYDFTDPAHPRRIGDQFQYN